MRHSLLWHILNCRKKSPSLSWPHNIIHLKKLVVLTWNLVQPTPALPSPGEARWDQDFASCTFYSRIEVLSTKILHRKENPTPLWYFISDLHVPNHPKLKMIQLWGPDINVSSLHWLQITSHNFNVKVAPSYPTSILSFFLCNSHHNESEHFRMTIVPLLLREKIDWETKKG